MSTQPYDQRAAAVLAVYLCRAKIHPNHVTAVSLILALLGASLLALGEAWPSYLGAGLFVVARFLDHVDGQVAVLADKRSTFGYYFDYVTGALSYAALFLGMGIGLADGTLGNWAYVLGGAGTVSAIVAAFLNVDLDRRIGLTDGESVGYPEFGGFELEDGIYLIAPIAWLGWLTPFFVLSGIGAAIYCIWTLGRLLVIRR